MLKNYSNRWIDLIFYFFLLVLLISTILGIEQKVVFFTEEKEIIYPLKTFHLDPESNIEIFDIGHNYEFYLIMNITIISGKGLTIEYSFSDTRAEEYLEGLGNFSIKLETSNIELANYGASNATGTYQITEYRSNRPYIYFGV